MQELIQTDAANDCDGAWCVTSSGVLLPLGRGEAIGTEQAMRSRSWRIFTQKQPGGEEETHSYNAFWLGISASSL